MAFWDAIRESKIKMMVNALHYLCKTLSPNSSVFIHNTFYFNNFAHCEYLWYINQKCKMLTEVFIVHRTVSSSLTKWKLKNAKMVKWFGGPLVRDRAVKAEKQTSWQVFFVLTSASSEGTRTKKRAIHLCRPNCSCSAERGEGNKKRRLNSVVQPR